MRRIAAQERWYVGRARQQIEATLLDGFYVASADAQASFDVCDTESARLALVAQQAANGPPRRRFPLNCSPIDLVRHSLFPSHISFSRGSMAGQKRFEICR